MTLEEIQTTIQTSPAVIFYLTADHCNVCKVLKPAIQKMIAERYPEITFLQADTVKSPEIAAHFNAFSIPLILVYFDGKEFFRKGRAMGIDELAEDLKRPYSMLFA